MKFSALLPSTLLVPNVYDKKPLQHVLLSTSVQLPSSHIITRPAHEVGSMFARLKKEKTVGKLKETAPPLVARCLVVSGVSCSMNDCHARVFRGQGEGRLATLVGGRNGIVESRTRAWLASGDQFESRLAAGVGSGLGVHEQGNNETVET